MSERDNRQEVVAAWCGQTFGSSHLMAVPQRGIRFLEEAIELAQACNVDKAMIHKLVDHVYSRPPGSLFQELGGVGVCTLALAYSIGVSADKAEHAELCRVLQMPTEHFRKRNAEKDEAGFKA